MIFDSESSSLTAAGRSTGNVVKLKFKSLIPLFIVFISIICGLLLFRNGLVEYTLHVTNKSPTLNPFVVPNSDLVKKKLWNSKLYDKVVLLVVNGIEISNLPNYIQEIKKKHQQQCVIRSFEESTQSLDSDIAAMLIGTRSEFFQVGNRNNQTRTVQEDSIFFQLNASSYTSAGYLNNKWYDRFPGLLTLNLNKTSKEGDSNFSDAIATLRSGQYDFIFIQEDLKARSTNDSVQEEMIIDTRIDQLINYMTSDTLLLVIGQRIQSCQGPSGTPMCPHSFLFSYNKNGFTKQEKLLTSLERKMKIETSTSSDSISKLETREKNIISKTVIASTISNLMGLTIPFSNSDRALLDLYPIRLNEIQLIQRILQDSYSTLQQEFTLLTAIQKFYDRISQQEFREIASEVEHIRLSLPNTGFNQTSIETLVSSIILNQQRIHQIILKNTPYKTFNIQFGLFLLFFVITIIFLFSRQKRATIPINSQAIENDFSSTSTINESEISSISGINNQIEKPKEALSRFFQFIGLLLVSFELSRYFYKKWLSIYTGEMEQVSFFKVLAILLLTLLGLGFIALIRNQDIRKLWKSILLSAIPFLIQSGFWFQSTTNELIQGVMFPLMYLVFSRQLCCSSNQHVSIFQQITSVIKIAFNFFILLAVCASKDLSIFDGVSFQQIQTFSLVASGINVISILVFQKNCYEGSLDYLLLFVTIYVSQIETLSVALIQVQFALIGTTAVIFFTQVQMIDYKMTTVLLGFLGICFAELAVNQSEVLTLRFLSFVVFPSVGVLQLIIGNSLQNMLAERKLSFVSTPQFFSSLILDYSVAGIINQIAFGFVFLRNANRQPDQLGTLTHSFYIDDLLSYAIGLACFAILANLILIISQKIKLKYSKYEVLQEMTEIKTSPF